MKDYFKYIRDKKNNQPLRKLSIKERRLFYRSLKKLLKIAPLTEAIKQIAELNKNTKKGKHLAEVCLLIASKIKNNIIMGESLKGIIPAEECTILIIGEKNGQLRDVLDSLIFLVDIKNGVIVEVIKALLYPVIMFVVTIFAFIEFKRYLVPFILIVAPASKWPPVTHLVVYIATTIELFWPLIIGAMVTILWLIAASMPRWTNSTIRSKLDQYPLYGTYRYLQSAVFLITLGILQKSGSSLDASLKEIRKISQPWLKEYLNQMIWKFRNEKMASKALDVGLIPAEQIAYIEIATRTGDLDDALNELGKESILEFKEVMGVLSIIANVFMMLILGMSILLLIFAWYGAIMPPE